MSTWTNLINALFIPGRPILGSTGLALRDNLLAVLEGDVTAPKIRIGAMERLVAGNSVRSRRDAEVINTGTGVFQLTGNSFAFLQAGSIRCSFDHKASGNAGYARVLRTRGGNSVEIASWGNSTSYVSRTADVDVLPGDTIDLQNTRTGALDLYLRNCRFSTSGVDLWPGSGLSLEGNVYA